MIYNIWYNLLHEIPVALFLTLELSKSFWISGQYEWKAKLMLEKSRDKQWLQVSNNTFSKMIKSDL